MALDPNELASILQSVFTVETNVPTVDAEGKALGTEQLVLTPNTDRMKAFASALIDYFKANAEIAIPDLPVQVVGTMSGSGSANVSGGTGSGGSPSHSHSFSGSGNANVQVPINIGTFARPGSLKGTIE